MQFIETHHREALAAIKAKEDYQRRHMAGETEQARADLARLAIVSYNAQTIGLPIISTIVVCAMLIVPIVQRSSQYTQATIVFCYMRALRTPCCALMLPV